jgi:hypothetical protein
MVTRGTETLTRLVNEGETVVDIAKAMQRTTAGVRGKLDEIGLKLSQRRLAEGSRPQIRN